ncbi:sensor histidine kinase RcsC [Paraliobacillus ryukyuensis]|uniref:histidine kinase n=1 Tax=Paraliobacillus ryukyuensis TaxID=200904 RepID=A0A366EGZ0_9BACI|nr:ATP-binding protein [Paraliobacillus ryukyuensis]RBP01608.1 phospho-acceptor domain-containing protein [Paraliobacillus ryukyuensis]
MHKTLRNKILFYLLVVSFCGIFLASFTILFGVQNHFSTYVQNDREKNIELIEQALITSYQTYGNLTGDNLSELLHDQAMTENLYYKILDEQGEVILNTTTMIGMMGMMHGKHSQKIEQGYESSITNLNYRSKQIGQLEVFYPVEFVGENFTFVKSIQRNIVIAIIITVILSIVFSLFFSRRLTTGFNQLSNAIERLQKHRDQAKVPVEKLTPEFRKLGESFNQLTDSLVTEDNLRKQFTADFAHELRTPIATLRSQIEAFQDGIWEPTPKRLEQSHHELMRLVRLVNELEKLIAAENPQIKLNKTTIDADQLIAQITNQLSTLFKEKKVQLFVNKTDGGSAFVGDHDKVVQIITNVLKNALNYTPEQGKVWITVKNEADFLGFVIQDQGTGIRQEDIPHLFERFYRGDKSRNRKTGGIGIGLSIVKALVDAHHGNINIVSELNVGTTVTIWIPKNE